MTGLYNQEEMEEEHISFERQTMTRDVGSRHAAANYSSALSVAPKPVGVVLFVDEPARIWILDRPALSTGWSLELELEVTQVQAVILKTYYMT